LEGTNIPVLDLQEALFKNHSDENLAVNGPEDTNPNEIAHEIASQEIFAFLDEESLIEPLFSKGE
jgi:hypothetical protein